MACEPVAVAILNWNCLSTLDKCLKSVQQQTYPAIDLRVLDNASADGSVAFLQEHYPDIPLTVFAENVGFAKAHNQAMRTTDSTYYMPLNPDLVLLPDYVTEMVKAIQQHERIGSVSGKLMFMMEDGRETDLIYSTGHLLTRSRSPTNRGYKKRDVGQYEQVEPIFAANGAAPLYRRAMLEDVALGDEYFCEDFFIYGEDHDLGWRAQLRGWQCLYTPHAVGYHCGFGSGGIQTPFVQVQFTRNRYLTLVRNDCLKDFLGDLPYVLLYELIWQLSRLVRSPRRLLAHWRGLVEAAKAVPRARQARDEIQQRRRVSPGYIRAFYRSQLW